MGTQRALIMAVQFVDKPVVVEQSDDRPPAGVHWWDRVANVYETESGPSRIVPMEGVRGFAVLLVFFVHFHVAFSAYMGSNSPLFHVSEFLGTVGSSGVDLFFIISGYLIYGAVIRPRFNYGRFMRRRVQRIYPTFLCVFLIFIALWVFSSNENFKFHGTIGQQAAYVAENFFLLPGMFRLRLMNTVTWSLSYEMFFYLALPLVLAVTGLRRASRPARISFFLALIAIGILISPLMAHPRIRLIGFLFGIVLFEVAEGFRNRRSTFTNLMAMVVYFCGLGLIFAIDKTVVIPEQIVAPLIALIAGLTSFAFCGIGFHGSGILSGLLSWAPLRWLGNMSYSYYLIHGLAIGVVRQSVRGMVKPGEHDFIVLGLFLLAFAASWVASTLLFVAIEKPLSIQVGSKTVRSPLPNVTSA